MSYPPKNLTALFFFPEHRPRTVVGMLHGIQCQIDTTQHEGMVGSRRFFRGWTYRSGTLVCYYICA